MDILGYLKNTHKNPKFGKVRQVPTREFPTKFPDWDLSHSSKFGIFVSILKYPKMGKSVIFSCEWSLHVFQSVYYCDKSLPIILDEVEQNIVICLWWADQYYLPKLKAESIIGLRDADKSRYFAITEFNHCFIIRSPSCFFLNLWISSGSEAICHFHARVIAKRRNAWFH